ncbi:hypothetical protein SADUNF_Sadunf07G0068000 [Salix dunnii]|uniref:Uncharacterized protein n=1 Tax=Salix dunnii TaxID=1413687 RepID=A0A835K592_9ROSI|nr:hypothetical protein SADUNF_Sadunf07G0068000 [Salix dunnii]
MVNHILVDDGSIMNIIHQIHMEDMESYIFFQVINAKNTYIMYLDSHGYMKTVSSLQQFTNALCIVKIEK